MQFFLLISMSRHVIVIVNGHFFTTRHWHSFMKGSEQSHLLQGTKHNTTLFRMPSIWCNSINIYPSPINKHDSLIPKGVKLKYWITIENIKSSSTWLPWPPLLLAVVSQRCISSEARTHDLRVLQVKGSSSVIGQRNYCNIFTMVKFNNLSLLSLPCTWASLLSLLLYFLGWYLSLVQWLVVLLFMQSIGPCDFLIPYRVDKSFVNLSSTSLFTGLSKHKELWLGSALCKRSLYVMHPMDDVEDQHWMFS